MRMLAVTVLLINLTSDIPYRILPASVRQLEGFWESSPGELRRSCTLIRLLGAHPLPIPFLSVSPTPDFRDTDGHLIQNDHLSRLLWKEQVSHLGQRGIRKSEGLLEVFLRLMYYGFSQMSCHFFFLANDLLNFHVKQEEFSPRGEPRVISKTSTIKTKYKDLS